MKLNFTVFMLAILVISVDISYSVKTKMTMKTQLLNLLNLGDGKAPSPPIVSSSYFLQKLYPGKEPIKYLEKSWTKMELKYFVVQGTNFYYGKNSLTRAIIEGINKYLK